MLFPFHNSHLMSTDIFLSKHELRYLVCLSLEFNAYEVLIIFFKKRMYFTRKMNTTITDSDVLQSLWRLYFDDYLGLRASL